MSPLSGPACPDPAPAAATPCVRVDVFRTMPDRSRCRAATDADLLRQLLGMNRSGRACDRDRGDGCGKSSSACCRSPWLDRWADSDDENVDTTFSNDGISTAIDGWSPNDCIQDAVSGDGYVTPWYRGHPDTPAGQWRPTTAAS